MFNIVLFNAALFNVVAELMNSFDNNANTAGTRRKLPEILAPAGSRKAFLGAVKAGADAVYLGGEKFGARAYAENFTKEDIVRSIREAHILGKKVYLTLNVLTKESELEETVRFAQDLYEEGLDGAIIQDLGVLASLHERCPGLALHASTQMSVTGPESVRFLKQIGVKRVVPARELSLKEIRILKEEEPIEVESFIHGAMCYAYSGRCLMSSFLGGRSGNRGRCAGTCRLPYKIIDSEGRNVPLFAAGKNSKNKGRNDRDLTYPLSMRDMCVLEILPDLIDAGIDSFKIEGRMKSPHYAAGVSALYRKYADRYVEWDASGRKTPWKVEAEDMKRLRSLYLRTDLSTGYYYKRNGRELLTIKEPGYAGTDDILLSEIEEKYLKDMPEREITGRAVFVPGEPARLIVCAEDLISPGHTVKAEVTGDIVQAAEKRPMEAAEIEKRLRKTGDSIFTFADLDVQVGGDVFLPVASLNALRRNALEALGEKIADLANPAKRDKDSDPGAQHPEQFESDLSYAAQSEQNDTADHPETSDIPGTIGIPGTPGIWAVVTTLPQLRAARRCGVNIIVEDTPEITGSLTEAERSECFAALPYVMRRSSRSAVRDMIGGGYKGVLVRNLEELSVLQECGYTGTILADSSLYQWNTAARDLLLEECDMIDLGWEISAKDMRPLLEGAGNKQMLNIYGRIPMMITAGCVKKTAGMCTRAENRNRKENGSRKVNSAGSENEFFYIEDRKGIRFPVRCDCSHCSNVIYNSLPQSLHGFVAQKDPVAMGAAGWLCIFTNESGDKTEEVLNWYKAAAQTGKATKDGAAADVKRVFGDYTTGHYKKSAL